VGGRHGQGAGWFGSYQGTKPIRNLLMQKILMTESQKSFTQHLSRKISLGVAPSNDDSTNKTCVGRGTGHHQKACGQDHSIIMPRGNQFVVEIIIDGATPKMIFCSMFDECFCDSSAGFSALTNSYRFLLPWITSRNQPAPVQASFPPRVLLQDRC